MVYIVQELQAEVRKRQAAVLRPEPGSEEEQLNAFQRQKRLRLFVAAGCCDMSKLRVWHVACSILLANVAHSMGPLTAIIHTSIDL
jgi:hypothetical protein